MNSNKNQDNPAQGEQAEKLTTTTAAHSADITASEEQLELAEENASTTFYGAPQPGLATHQADLGVEELEPIPTGQLSPLPIKVPVERQRLVWLKTLLRNPKARIGLVIVFFFILLSILAPVLAAGDPAEFVGPPNQPPGGSFLLGTDPQGKDVYRQLVWGGQSSLLIGFGTGLVSTVIAVIVGLIAGYYRGRVDDILTLVMNLFLVIPGLALLIVFAAYFQAGLITVILALSVTGWAFNARILRAQALSLREKDFVAAAKVSGESNLVIIFREMLPNLLNVIVGGFIGAVTYGLLAATGLAFLGLTSTTEVNWGTNLFWAQNGGAIGLGAWWTFLPSGLAVALVAFGLSLINYGMDEITNPRLRAERELQNVIKNARQRRIRATPVVPREH
jgi:peptide/nickel transport system permease protein